MERIEKGRNAEELAREFLESRGLSLREKNWRCGHREIDLILEGRDRIHIVEVRSLTLPSLQEPEETITHKKIRNIISATSAYIARYKIVKEVQFDIVAVKFGGKAVDIEYYPNAFSPTW